MPIPSALGKCNPPPKTGEGAADTVVLGLTSSQHPIKTPGTSVAFTTGGLEIRDPTDWH